MRTLRHLPLFWLGLFPLVILLWAYADSLRYCSSWGYAPKPDRWDQITLWAAGIQIDTASITALPGHEGEAIPGGEGLVTTGPWGEWKRRADRNYGTLKWFAKPWSETFGYPIEKSHHQGGIQRRIPLWLIIAPYLLLWFALTAWQARRWKRKHAKI